MREKVTTITILLIEDNAADANYLRALLSEYPRIDFDIRRASRVAEGVKLLDKGGIDLILSDLNLPDSTGMETIKAVRIAAPDLPVIMLTSLDDEDFAITAVQEGAQDYLVKSDVDAVTTVRAIKYAIERKKMENEKNRLILDLQDARQRLRSLARLLPVCPSCGRTADDDRFRERVGELLSTAYLPESEPVLCPDCAAKGADSAG
jgi:DNA-binding NarL/FixJ family response regulator